MTAEPAATGFVVLLLHDASVAYWTGAHWHADLWEAKRFAQSSTAHRVMAQVKGEGIMSLGAAQRVWGRRQNAMVKAAV